MRVAAGAIARKIVPGLNVRAALIQIGSQTIDRAAWDWAEVERNPFFCPDAKAAAGFADFLDGVRKKGSSVGAIIEVIAEGVPAGLGAPVYAKLDGDLAGALMGINAVKGVEIGAGFAAATLSGDMQGAQSYFGKAIQNAHDPRTLAWSHIYLGRILDIQENRDGAVEHYRAALAAGDPTPDTKVAAEKGLAAPYEPRKPR